MNLRSSALFFLVLTTLPNLALSNACFEVYSGSKTVVEHPNLSLLSHIQSQIAADPHGFPEYIVGQALAQDLAILTQKYQATMAQIASKGPNNKASFTLLTISSVLDNFNRLALSLGKELDKEKRDLKKIKQDSEELQSCFGNLRQCETNLPIAVRAARENLLHSKQLVIELEKKKREIDELAVNLVNMIDLPVAVLDGLNRTLAAQERAIDSYLSLLTSAIEMYEHIETQLRVQTPEIQTALLEVAILQSKGATIEGSLEMNPASLNSTLEDVLVFDAHSFVVPKNQTEQTPSAMGKVATSELFLSSTYEKGTLATLGEIISLQKKINPTYYDVLNIYDIEKLIQGLLLHPKLDYKTLFPPKFFDGIGKTKIAREIKGANLHFLLFMIDGFNPAKYRESIQWLISKLSNSIEMVKSSDLGYVQKKLRLINIKMMISGYQNYLNSSVFNSDLNSLLDLKGRHLIHLSMGWQVAIPTNFAGSEESN